MFHLNESIGQTVVQDGKVGTQQGDDTSAKKNSGWPLFVFLDGLMVDFQKQNQLTLKKFAKLNMTLAQPCYGLNALS